MPIQCLYLGFYFFSDFFVVGIFNFPFVIDQMIGNKVGLKGAG